MQKLKASLRAELIARRREMEETDRKISDEKIYNNLIAMPLINAAQTVLCYVSTPIEVDTRALILYLLSAGKTVAAPLCIGRDMKFLAISSLSDLRAGKYGVMEPSRGGEITDFSGAVCVTPALSISREGCRLGYGGGFYDRFFEKHPCVSVGLCYERFIGEVPRESFDIKLDHIVTENEIISVTK